jgi:hypothetical protein
VRESISVLLSRASPSFGTIGGYRMSCIGLWGFGGRLDYRRALKNVAEAFDIFKVPF